VRVESLPRWYPRAWRERYGDELAALIEDEFAGRRPGARDVAAIARAGLAERVRSATLLGARGNAAERARGGALTVLAAWCATTLAGAAFAKSAEHVASSLAPARRAGAQVAYVVVVAGGVIGLVAILVGAAVAAPSAWRSWRAGRLADLRPRARVASVLVGVAALSLAGLAEWAAHLSVAQRNGADGAYAAVAVTWAVLVSAAVAGCGAWAVGVGGRCDLSRTALRAERVLAAVAALGAAAVAAGVVAWWVLMAELAPNFLSGPGAHGVAPAPLVLAATLSGAAALVALYGAARSALARD
jgi:hypothetical protein